MKYLTVPALVHLNAALNEVADPDNTDSTSRQYCSVDAYTFKKGREDKKITATVSRTLPNIYCGNLEVTAMEETVAQPDPNVVDVGPPYAVYTDLICALHRHYNSEYDFSTVPTYAFTPISWAEAECEVSLRVRYDPHRRLLWRTLHDLFGGADATSKVSIYSYSDTDSHNPLRSMLWARHYLFYCRKNKLLVLIVMYARSGIYNHDENADYASPGRSIHSPSPAGHSVEDTDFDRWESMPPLGLLAAEIASDTPSRDNMKPNPNAKKRERRESSPQPLEPSPVTSQCRHDDT